MYMSTPATSKSPSGLAFEINDHAADHVGGGGGGDPDWPDAVAGFKLERVAGLQVEPVGQGRADDGFALGQTLGGP